MAGKHHTFIKFMRYKFAVSALLRMKIAVQSSSRLWDCLGLAKKLLACKFYGSNEKELALDEYKRLDTMRLAKFLGFAKEI